MSNLTTVKSRNNTTLHLDKIGVIYNTEHFGAKDVAVKIEKLLTEKGFNVVTHELSPAKKQESREYIKDVTFAIIIGGDGSLLGAARYYAGLDIPVFGINTGRLGFLSQLKPDYIEVGIEKILKGEFKIEDRLMLQATNDLEKPGFSFSALNDIVIKGGTLSRTARLFLYINGQHVCDYLADGLIFSTPTGSTAYTLSAGGPVLVPGLNAIVIVPICPHSLTTRPLVVPADEKIEVKTCSNCDLIYLTADGQENINLKSNDTIYIRKYEKKAKLILLDDDNNGFYSVLREKLHWGVSPKG